MKKRKPIRSSPTSPRAINEEEELNDQAGVPLKKKSGRNTGIAQGRQYSVEFHGGGLRW